MVEGSVASGAIMSAHARGKVIKATARFSARREREQTQLAWGWHAACRSIPREQLEAIIKAVTEKSEAPLVRKLPAEWAVRALAIFREWANRAPVTGMVVPFKAKT